MNAFIIRILDPQKEFFEESEELSHTVIRPLCEKYGISVEDASEISKTGRVSNQILRAISEADVVFAEASSNNENVWFEIGYCHKENPEKLIVLSKKDRTLPFDIMDYRAVPYDVSYKSFLEVCESIEKMLKEIIIASGVRNRLRHKNFIEEFASFLQENRDNCDMRLNIVKELERIVGDINYQNEYRARACMALAMTDEMKPELIGELFESAIDETMQIAVAKSLVYVNRKIPIALWKVLSCDRNTHGVLRNVAQSAVNSYEKGLISKDGFYDVFLTSKAWIIRKHVAVNLLEKYNERNDTFLEDELRVMSADDREEVFMRFVEWLESEVDQKRAERIKAILRNEWRNSKNDKKVSYIKKMI